MICVKEYAVLSECIERGINTGYNRAYKHTDTPTWEYMNAEIYKAIMNEVSDYFVFEEQQ